MLHTFFIAAY